MRTLLVLCSVFLASVALAAPFLVCDSYVAPAVIPDYFKVSLDGGAESQSVKWTGTTADGTALQNALHFDAGAVTVGNHIVQVKACKAADVWNAEACSVASPFSFGRPAPPTAPAIPTGTTLSR